MSEVEGILKSIEGTKEAELILETQQAYERISREQGEWYNKCNFYCPEGCGSCCHNFEPDLLEGEALFMAAWLIENREETALKVAEGIFPFENGKTCLFHDYDNPYHCTIYNGRPSICRLFGATGARDKSGKKVWKPCKFYPAEKLALHNPPLAHRQYSAEETEELLGAVPPVMSDLMEQFFSQTEIKKTKTIREILPETVRRLLWLRQMCNAEKGIL